MAAPEAQEASSAEALDTEPLLQPLPLAPNPPADQTAASSSAPSSKGTPTPLTLPAVTTPTKSLKNPAVPPSPSALARPSPDGRTKPLRNVTFDPNPVTRTIQLPTPSSSPPVDHPAASFRQRIAPSATITTPALSATAPLSYGTASVPSSARLVGIAGGVGAFSSGAVVNGAGGGGIGVGGSGGLAAINNRLRRRNSYGSGPLGTQQPPPLQLPKIGPQRSTKNAQKLKLLPNPDFGEEGPDEESGRDVYSQYTRIKDPTARRDAALLGKADRARLPRVTAYCTANRYEMDGLMRFLKGRGKTRGGNPKLIDECIYTPYDYEYGKREVRGSDGTRGGGHRGNSSRVSHYSYLSDSPSAGGGQFFEQPREASEPEQQERRQDEGSDELQPSASHYQERRHSAGEVDSDHPQQRRDDLIDLGAGGSGEERRHQSEEAVVDDDEILPGRTRNSDDVSYDNGQHQQEHHRRQAEDAVLDLLDGDHLDRQAAGDDPGQLQDEFEQQLRGERPVDFDIQVHTPELFLFDYGVVVIWGMSEAQEQRFLKELAKFETEKLGPDDVEAEFFNFYYTREYQARIYNDFIALRDKGNYMTKLAISHALAQSVKTSLFEELIASTIETCKDIPTQIALTGTIALSRTQINMQIGELFILRINIHLNGSVLDTPELFWVEPQLEPVYQAVRSYLEMDQRVGLLTQRLDVIADLLAVLKEQLSHGHGEMLEWIEILVAAINIVVDLYAGV